MAWYVEQEYQRLRNKTPLEQEGEKIKEKFSESGATNSVYNDKIKSTYNPNVRNFNAVKFEFTDIVKVFYRVTERIINVYDGYIEYQQTGDELKVITKIGTNVISNTMMLAGTSISLETAIVAGTASSVFLTPIGGTIVGVGVFVVGVGTSYWISDNAGTMINAGLNGMINFIREADMGFGFSLTEGEIRQLNLAHCHKSVGDRRQMFRNQIGHQRILINDKDFTNIIYPNPNIIPNKPFINDKTIKDIMKKTYGIQCTSITTILPNARGLKKFNGDYPIMQHFKGKYCA